MGLTEFAIVGAISVVIGIIEYCIYEMGKGYYGEDKYLIIRKATAWILRIGMAICMTKIYTNPISVNEFWLFVFGYHFLSSLPTQGTYYQLKRWWGDEVLFHFFSHSINGLIWTGDYYLDADEKQGKFRYPIIDLYAFIRILLGLLGFIMLTVEYY